jgi:catechol 2,3-dioxygenase-like lactoylglutathione lyase family enzyme
VTNIPYIAIDHVQLAMPAGEEATARRFYCDLLGMTEVAKPPELAKRGGCGSRAAAYSYIWESKPIFGLRRRHILRCAAGTMLH